MEPVDILLLEEGSPNSGFRTKNAPGDKARAVLIDRGDALVFRAALVSVARGQFTAEGDPASLLVFEFSFQSMKSSRRFTSAKIILKFDDASNNVENRPQVYAIAPAGTFAINKTIVKRDVHQAVSASLKGEFAGVGGELGYVWDTTKVKEVTHATSLVGVKRTLSDFGKDDGVIWNMEEDAGKGIPSFLRTAVLLRHRDDVPFRFTLDVETGVDWEGRLRRLLGLERPDPVDPVELDGETDLDGLGIASLDPTTGEDLTNMRDMDIAKQADVVLATLLQVPV